MMLVLLAVLAQNPKPQHVLQCADAANLVAALVSSGVSTDAGSALVLPELSCGVASGPPGTRHYRCTRPALRGADAQRLWDALAATRIEPVAAAMQAVFDFSSVRCEQTALGWECALTNEMRAGLGDLRGEKVVRRRTSCAR